MHSNINALKNWSIPSDRTFYTPWHLLKQHSFFSVIWNVVKDLNQQHHFIITVCLHSYDPSLPPHFFMSTTSPRLRFGVRNKEQPLPCPGAMQKLEVWDLFGWVFSWEAVATVFARRRSASCAHSTRSSCFQHRSVRSAKSAKPWWWPSIPKSAAHLEWMRTSDFPVCMLGPSAARNDSARLPLTWPGADGKTSQTNTEELISPERSSLLHAEIRNERREEGSRHRNTIRTSSSTWTHITTEERVELQGLVCSSHLRCSLTD